MIKKILIIFAIVLLLGAGGFVLWGSTPAGPSQAALQALTSDNAVVVTSFPKWMAFEPTESEPASVVVFYPGGRVDYRAYAPSARRMAASGHLVLLMRMPLNLAVFGVNRVEEAMNAYPVYQTWALGGHSLGGAMAASYAYNNPGRIDGLFLWASYPVESQSLAAADLPVLSISATLDGLATPGDISASRQYLPASTVFVEIEGGNHAQFGSYGPQNGDNQAAISAGEQLAQIAAAMESFLQSIRP
jgi:pimeloyl-ACP methyl ester carboxylesterase